MKLNIIKLRLFKKLILILVLLSVFSSYSISQNSIKIALSKGKGSESYLNYSKWIKSLDSTVECIDLYHIPIDEALKILNNCDGLVLTGGPDVEPGTYGKPGDSSRCEIDFTRDTLEFALINLALENKIPILGVCRGLQIFNVAMKGTLIVDIKDDYSCSVVHQCKDTYDCFHSVKVNDNTLLSKLVGVQTGMVNTNHHQGIDKLGKNLKISARSDDMLIEAIEWENPAGLPFFMAVQWHPERLEPDNPFSKSIGTEFVAKVKSFYIYKQK